jgi:hypothetical protein
VENLIKTMKIKRTEHTIKIPNSLFIPFPAFQGKGRRQSTFEFLKYLSTGIKILLTTRFP